MYYVIFTDAEIHHNYTLFGPFETEKKAEEWSIETVKRWNGTCNIVEAQLPL